LLARSTRPFACGVLAHRGVQGTAELRHAVALDCPGAIDPKDAMLVAVERDRFAMRIEILAGRLEVVEGRFRLDEL